MVVDKNGDGSANSGGGVVVISGDQDIKILIGYFICEIIDYVYNVYL